MMTMANEAIPCPPDCAGCGGTALCIECGAELGPVFRSLCDACERPDAYTHGTPPAERAQREIVRAMLDAPATKGKVGR